LTLGSPQSKSRDLRQDRFRKFPVTQRFDTLWAGHCLMQSAYPG
jgi:hypothetical protein